MDDDYYHCLQSGTIEIDSVPVLSAEFILPFKARAWLDLSGRKQAGEKVDSKTVKKHRNDVFRLSVLLAPTQRVELASTIKQDMAAFLTAMEIENGLDLKNFGITSRLVEVLSNLRSIYELEV